MATTVSFQDIKYNKSDTNLMERSTLLLINQQFKHECFHKQTFSAKPNICG
jgi:hypothetical protein